MDNEKNIPELSPEDRATNELLNDQEAKVKQERTDLSSARKVLYKLLKRGDITAQDKLIDVLRVIEEEYARIEDIRSKP